jgi:hypothetical protein
VAGDRPWPTVLKVGFYGEYLRKGVYAVYINNTEKRSKMANGGGFHL